MIRKVRTGSVWNQFSESAAAIDVITPPSQLVRATATVTAASSNATFASASPSPALLPIDELAHPIRIAMRGPPITAMSGSARFRVGATFDAMPLVYAPSDANVNDVHGTFTAPAATFTGGSRSGSNATMPTGCDPVGIVLWSRRWLDGLGDQAGSNTPPMM